MYVGTSKSKNSLFTYLYAILITYTVLS